MSNSTLTGRGISNKDYWDELDRLAEEREKPFQKEDQSVVFAPQEWARLKQTHQEEISHLENEIVYLNERVDKLRNTIAQQVDRFGRLDNLARNQESLLKSNDALAERLLHLIGCLVPRVYHKEDCVYIDKLSSGRKIEVNEEKDCTCGYHQLMIPIVNKTYESDAHVNKHRSGQLDYELDMLRYGDPKR